MWKNACLNYREFDLEGDLVGVPHTWYLSAQSFIKLFKLVWREYDIVALNEWKKKCVGLHRTWVSKHTVQGKHRPSNMPHNTNSKAYNHGGWESIPIVRSNKRIHRHAGFCFYMYSGLPIPLGNVNEQEHCATALVGSKQTFINFLFTVIIKPFLHSFGDFACSSHQVNFFLDSQTWIYKVVKGCPGIPW